MDTPVEMVRPGIYIPRELWGKIRNLSFQRREKPEVVVERFLVEGLKREGADQ